jgi:hypothetical protein
VEESRAATLSKQRLIFLLYAVLLIFLFANTFFLHAFFQTWTHLGPDWPIFLSAGEALSKGESPYPPDLLERGPTQPDGAGWQDYIYPPLFARIVGLLSPLGPFWSLKVYLVLCLLLYVGLLFPRWNRGADCFIAFALQFALFFSWGPVIQNFRMGQSDFIALFLFTTAWRLLSISSQRTSADEGEKLGLFRYPRQGFTPLATFVPSLSGLKNDNPARGGTEVARGSHPWRRAEDGWALFHYGGSVRIEWLAGLLIGISFGIKLTPALVLPLFLIAGRWRIVGGFAIGAVLSAFLPDPATSYEYFTRVLPTLVSDLSIMEGRPALHLTLARLFDSILYGFFKTGLPPMTLSILGILASGTIFSLLLYSVFKIGNKIRTSDLLLVACFLPPIFAANLRHHFALALLPAMVGVKRIVEGRSAGGRIRIAFLLLALLPTCYYTLPVRMLSFAYGEGQPISLNRYITLGQLAALILLWPYLLDCRGSSKDNKASA